MIFALVVAEDELLVTAYKEPALLSVSVQVRSEARKVWYQETELIVFVGSNFADRAQQRRRPGSSSNLQHVKKLRESAGLIDIDHRTNSFLKAIHPDAIFRNVRFQIYNEARLEHTRLL